MSSSAGEPLLLTISYSHFCEKARWALEYVGVPFREEGHLPMLSRFAGLMRGAWHSVPILFTDQGSVRGSGAIVRWADAHAQGDRRLYFPEEPELQHETEALEAEFDDVLGTEARRFAYHHVLGHRELAMNIARSTPVLERALAGAGFPVMRAMMRRGMEIDAATAERAGVRIDEVFDDVAVRLGDGRPYLVGERFSAADLTFAALAAAVLLPSEHPIPQPGLDRYPLAASARYARWRAHPAGRFALRLYATER